MRGTKALLKKLVPNSEGWRQILLGDEVRSLVARQAEEIAARAGDGFNPSVYEGDYGGGRVIGSVWADTYSAMVAEASEKRLTKAVG